MLGETVSHYRIVDELGAGGMGIVYRAEDVRLGRMVALKFLPVSGTQSRQALQRFQREARTASALNHPGICTVFDIGERDGQPFIAMELLEGQTLRDLLTSRRLVVSEAIDLAVQITDALDAAHAEKVLHRDIKPANLFVTRRGHAKILDFGLAKLAEGGQSSGAHPAADATLTIDPTLSGTTVGTIAYMSPEQARAETLDARSDLFSFGAVLYEMLTGQQAFPGASTAVTFDKILNRTPPSPRTSDPDLPPELERIVLKALEKDRELRYQSAADLRSDLQRLTRDLSSGSIVAATAAAQPNQDPPDPPFSASGSSVYVPTSVDSLPTPVKLLIAAGVIALVAAVGIGSYLAGGSATADPDSQEATASEDAAATGETAVAGTSVVDSSTDLASAEPEAPAPADSRARTPSRAPAGPAGDTAARDLEVARSKVEANLHDQALEDLQAIIDQHPDGDAALEAHFLKATVFQRQRQLAEAMATYVEIRGRFGESNRAPEAMYRQAHLLLKSNRRNRDVEARRLFTELADQHPTTEWARLSLMSKGALEEDKRIREPDPALGRRVPAALVTYRLVAERFPNDSEEALWRLGNMYDDLDRYPLALQAFTDLATRFPETTFDAWYRVGQLYERRLDDRGKALAAYQQIPTTSQRYQDAQDRIRRLSR